MAEFLRPAFLRPAARAAVWRWREVIFAGLILALGLWWGFQSYGFVRWVAGLLGLVGLLTGLIALQRLRFAMGGGGPGVVQVDERQLAYFGPLSGGVIDLPDLVRVDLDPTGKPAHWVLTDLAGQVVHIPVNAAGAEALFDVFAALPGIRTGRMLELLQHNPAGRVLIWQTTARARLH